MSARREIVERALSYPFSVPPTSFLLAGEELREDDTLGPDDSHAAGRRPLLAYGSNAAPEVLMRKLGDATRSVPLLALRATLADHDAVYSAHISRYGSIPATLHSSPSAKLPVFVLYPDSGQAEKIALTEPNYEPVRLSGIACQLDSGASLGELDAYRSRHGCLLLESREVALAAIDTSARSLPALSQAEVQECLRALLAPDRSLERFVVENATDTELALRRTEMLGA